MPWKLINADPPVTYAIALQTGNDAVKCLSDFVREQEIEAASITAISAFCRALLGYFEWQSKQYKKIPVEEQVEVLSLLGDVAVSEGKPTLHIHAVLGKSDSSVAGGHLLSSEVRRTREVIITQSPSYLRKAKDPETGFALLAIDPATLSCATIKTRSVRRSQGPSAWRTTCRPARLSRPAWPAPVAGSTDWPSQRQKALAGAARATHAARLSDAGRGAVVSADRARPSR